LDDSAKSFVAAQQAMAEGDKEKAKELLTNSIAARPDPWAYFQRAQLYADEGEDQAARADCQAGLELDPENTNLQWLAGELKKPKGNRFQGEFAEPPMTRK
jgi:tetratricopeptide (TPR) repeat protein